MLIVSELIVPVIAGLLRVLGQLVLVLASAFVAAPQVTTYVPSPRELYDFFAWPFRAAARHPRRLALLIAACVAGVALLVRG